MIGVGEAYSYLTLTTPGLTLSRRLLGHGVGIFLKLDEFSASQLSILELLHYHYMVETSILTSVLSKN